MKLFVKRILPAVAALFLCGPGLFADAPQKPEPLSDSLYRSLAATPPMGWNSWNKFGCNVSEKLIKEMADAMAGLQCDYLQGYYFSRPLPMDEFAAKYLKGQS